MNLDRFRNGGDPPPLPLTPLVDVLFLMIIFLVLGANFDQVETVRLPEAEGRAVGESATVRLELRADGRLWLDGNPLADAEVISALRLHAPETVMLLPDRKAEVGLLIRWYDRIRRALSVPVQIGVRPPAPP